MLLYLAPRMFDNVELPEIPQKLRISSAGVGACTGLYQRHTSSSRGTCAGVPGLFWTYPVRAKPDTRRVQPEQHATTDTTALGKDATLQLTCTSDAPSSVAKDASAKFNKPAPVKTTVDDGNGLVHGFGW